MTPAVQSVGEPVTRTDGEACAAIARTHARTFALAAGLLPGEKRRGAFALYAFCRIADDIADGVHSEPGGADPGPGPHAGARDAAAALAAHRAALHQTLRGRPEGPLFRELAWTLGRFAVPAAALEELLAGIGRDLTPVHHADAAELRAYCEAVAGSVGEMCAHVFGVPGSSRTQQRAVRFARTLGVAMQLTNILRDIGEDARRGRCYLPDDELAAAGLTRGDVLNNTELAGDPRWRSLMRRQIARARQLYARAERGIALLEVDARPCATACARGYALILDAIEQQAYDTIRSRAVVSRWRKAQLLMSMWRTAAR